MMVKNKKVDPFEGIEFPSNEQVRRELGNFRISEGGKRAYQKPGRLEKQKKAMQTRDNTAHKDAGKKRAADPEWKAKHKAAIEEFRNDPVKMAEYEKNNREAYLKAKEDPAYWEAYYAAIKVRDADPEYHKKRIDASKKKICRKVQTPLGVFDSITDAANAHGMGNTETMRHRLKSPNFPDFLLLDDVAKKPQKKKK
jgi:hypothetical protein